MNFNVDSVTRTSFGVVTRRRDEVRFYDVPINNEVRGLIREMVASTESEMAKVSVDPTRYEPSEYYPGRQHIATRLSDPNVEFFRSLYETPTYEPGGGRVLDDPRFMVCYFARLIDDDNQRLVAVRRATEFKSALGKANRLLFWDDELRVAGRRVFYLDNDFDVLIDDEEVRILRTKNFEHVGGLQAVLKEAAAENVEAIQKALPFIEIQEGAIANPTLDMARKVAATRSQLLAGMTEDRLRQLCDENDVQHQETPGGGFQFANRSAVEGLMDVLDRRRYTVEIIDGQPERYHATGRKRIVSQE